MKKNVCEKKKLWNNLEELVIRGNSPIELLYSDSVQLKLVCSTVDKTGSK